MLHPEEGESNVEKERRFILEGIEKAKIGRFSIAI